jgi:hypothetical protein
VRHYSLGALASGLALLTAPVAAWASSTYVAPIVTVGASPTIYSYGPVGERAAMPVVIAADPPSALQGDITVGEVFARHRLKVTEARVLTAPASGLGGLSLPAGTVLARVDTRGGAGPVVWCDLRVNPSRWSRTVHICLADSRNSGRFDQAWTGTSAADFLLDIGLASVVGTPTAMPMPATYRPARPEEGPFAVVGLRFCSGNDGASARFAVAASVDEGQTWFNLAPCVLGKPDADGVTVGDLRLTLTPPVTPGATLHYEVAGRFPAGAVLSRLSIFPAGRQTAASSVSDLKALVVRSDIEPVIATGVRGKGESFLSLGVRHGLTGVLSAPVEGKGWFFRQPLAAGTPVYGIPMAGTGAQGIVWCAPRLDPNKSKKEKRWIAACLPNDVNGNAWVAATPALMTDSLSWYSGLGRTSNAPQVQPQAIDLPPMTLSYAFGGWNGDHWLILDVRIDWGEGPQRLRSILLPPASDGTVTAKIMGGEFVLREIPGGPPKSGQVSVEVKTQPGPDAPLLF